MSKLTSTLIAPALATIVLSVIALVSVWTQQPLLALSLGSATFTQVLAPRTEGAKPYSTFMGQAVGVVAGMLSVHLCSAASLPMFMGVDPLVNPRVLAIAVAVFICAALQLVTGAKSPAGGATALTLAMGAETADWAGVLRLAVGICLVTALGEVARRIVLRWSAA